LRWVYDLARHDAPATFGPGSASVGQVRLARTYMAASMAASGSSVADMSLSLGQASDKIKEV